MILYLASFIIFLFVSFNLFFRTDCSLFIKSIGTIIIFLVSIKYLIYQFMGGAFFSPQMPRLFLLTMESLYGSLLILFFLLLLYDIYLGGNWILAHFGIPVPKNLHSGMIKSGLAIISLLFGIYGTWQAIKIPDVRTVEISSTKLPEEFNGFSIIQLSDLHIGPILGKEWLEEVVKKTNAQTPDLIVLTGDYIDGTVAELGDELETLARLKAKYGIYGVTGNHEYYWNAEEWKKTLKNMGIELLENTHEQIHVGDQILVLAGVPDIAAARFGLTAPDINKALENAPEAFRILLAHQPKLFHEFSNYIDLQLAGHTHGGLMFFIKPLVARFNNGFVNGLYSKNNALLYVHPGTGLWNGFSSRVGAPSEITRIILRRS